MKLALSIDGMTKDVSCEQRDDGFVVSVEGREYRVSEVSRKDDTLSFFVDRTAHTARVSPAVGGAWFSVAGRTFRLTEEQKDTDRPVTRGSGGDGKLEAPMPGNVVSVNVTEGQSVTAGTPVVVIESMKMMNEIAATADGQVRRVHCRAGQHVGFGDVLVEIEADKGTA